MGGFSDLDILRVWDQGRNRSAADQALILLENAFPEAGFEELGFLSVGERDEALARLREKLFGRDLEGSAACGNCSERLSFSLDTAELIPSNSSESDPPSTLDVVCGDWLVKFRLPNVEDMRAVAGCGSQEAGTRVLLERCVLETRCSNRPVAAKDLPEKIVDHIGESMLQHDPNLEIILELKCPACDKIVRTIFDIATFLWSDVESLARGVLMDVADLAREYGWSEQQVLNMNPYRRQCYLKLARS